MKIFFLAITVSVISFANCVSHLSVANPWMADRDVHLVALGVNKSPSGYKITNLDSAEGSMVLSPVKLEDRTVRVYSDQHEPSLFAGVKTLLIPEMEKFETYDFGSSTHVGRAIENMDADGTVRVSFALPQPVIDFADFEHKVGVGVNDCVEYFENLGFHAQIVLKQFKWSTRIDLPPFRNVTPNYDYTILVMNLTRIPQPQDGLGLNEVIPAPVSRPLVRMAQFPTRPTTVTPATQAQAEAKPQVTWYNPFSWF